MAASDQTVLQFNSGPSSTSLLAKVHPLVIFNVCDCYVRRPDQADRVIGTLLGSVLPDGTVDIRNSYAVPHNESSDQVALDIDYHRNMLLSHQKVNPKEVIVGWYSTGLGVTGGSALIHEFYSREVLNPIHLTVDTGFTNGEGTIKAYVSANLTLGDHQLAAQFQEIPIDLRMVEAERVGYDLLKTPMVDKIPSDLEGMEVSMQRLLALIDDVYKYVDDVVEGHTAADNRVGRLISEAVASLPKLPPSVFDNLVNDGLQDQLLLLYLSSITRTQLSLAEKLNTAAQSSLSSSRVDPSGVHSQFPTTTISTLATEDVFYLLPNLNVAELIKSFAVKTNDVMLVIYLSSLIPSVIALHNLINNKIQNKEHEKAEDSQ